MRERESFGQQVKFLTWALVFAAVIAPGSTAGAADVASGIEAVEKLIHDSSAAAQVRSSGGDAAKARHQEAEALYERAAAAARSGESDAANNLLSQAKRAMIEAVNLAGRESVVDDKKRADFTKRQESVDALLGAYERIRGEKAANATPDPTGPQARARVARAREHFEAGRLDEARRLLDEAYLMVKLGIEHLREGDTLVRSLKFANKEEEYRYELDRNDTHRMLVNLLLKEKLNTPEVAQTVQPLLDRATGLRQQAEAAAASSQYESAIATLEESTAQLVRAIRAAGIYIPG